MPLSSVSTQTTKIDVDSVWTRWVDPVPFRRLSQLNKVAVDSPTSLGACRAEERPRRRDYCTVASDWTAAR